MTLTFQQSLDAIARLVKQFNTNRADYLAPGFKEAQARQALIDPLFIALGWDVHNSEGVAPDYQFVLVEESRAAAGHQRAPDYTFRTSKHDRKFFAEAKKPGIALKSSADSSYQLRSYGWNARLPLSILTDFEEFAVYNCRRKPLPKDKPNVARLHYYTCEEYAERWREIWDVFSLEAVRAGAFDQFARSGQSERGASTVDADFLETIEGWRKALAQLIQRDPQGRYWALGADSGRWNVFQSGAWVEAAPYPGAQPPTGVPAPPPTLPAVRAAAPPGPIYLAPPPLPVYTAPPPMYTAAATSPVRAEPPAASANSGGGCGRTLGCGCLVVLLLIVACAAGLFWASRSGLLTTATFLNLAGLGPARMEVDNFRDDGIDVSFRQLDATKDSSPIEGALQLNAFDVKAFHTPNAAKFHVDFVTSASPTSLGTCTLSVRSGEQFQFVALPGKIVTKRVNNPPKTGTDHIVQSSTLCR